MRIYQFLGIKRVCFNANMLNFSFSFCLSKKKQKRPHENQPKAFLGALAALLGPENFRFALFVDVSRTQRNYRLV